VKDFTFKNAFTRSFINYSLIVSLIHSLTIKIGLKQKTLEVGLYLDFRWWKPKWL